MRINPTELAILLSIAVVIGVVAAVIGWLGGLIWA